MTTGRLEPDTPSNWEDAITRARQGERMAQGRVLDECRHYLLAIARRLLDDDLRPKAGESDLVQETYQEAYRIFERFEGEDLDDLIAWLSGILKNKMADLRRRYRHTAKRQVTRERPVGRGPTSSEMGEQLVSEGRSPSSFAVHREDVACLEEALSCLPRHYRLVLELRNAKLLPFAEIAEQMDLTAEAARKLWTRAVLRLEREVRKRQQP